MKERKSSEKIETAQDEPLTQTPTIRDAVTYIVDEQGNEVKKQSESGESKVESGE